ncbi:unnamed protein product [Bursaphelenchus okinawaensis]|uniref:Uncharacterized protein n=1 Tax=Bursaphelenchus okinawaensis TaxID=465554 RepID=A0A811KMV5_9BILA|nr:unnamed protein product [Bursaphelenchus okinawaensis]CAG9106395.1 unnamed protein product [Bursaphelenchus okinawaensis]
MISTYVMGLVFTLFGVIAQAAMYRQSFAPLTASTLGEPLNDPSFLLNSPYPAVYFANNADSLTPAKPQTPAVNGESTIANEKRAYMRLGKRAYMRLGKRSQKFQELMEKRARLRLG